MNLKTDKRFKFGGLAVLLTVAVVAVIIVINVIVYNLASKYDWYFDMTPENINSLSDGGKALLDSIDPSGNNITIYFLVKEDQMTMGATSSDYFGNGTLWGMKPIYQLAKEIDDRYDFISVDFIDLNKEPNRIRKIVGSDYYRNASFSKLSIIIDNLIEYKDQNGNVYDTGHNFKVYSRDTFYTFNYSNYMVDAFRGEYRLCSAITSVTVKEDKAPVVYFVSGHGEEVGEYNWTEEDTSVNYGGAQGLWQLFRDCGYVAKRINLAYEDFGPDENAVVVIYSPKTDFIDKTTSQSFDEIAKLKDFLSLNNHSLYVCIDYGSQDLPVLEGFLLDSFGVKYGKEKLTDSGANSVSIDGFALSAGLNREGNGISGRVIQNSESTGGSKKAIFNIARSLDVDASKGTQILCTVPETVTNNDAGNGLLCLAETDGSGIAVISGSSNFTASYYLDSYVYLNRDLTLNLIAEMTSDAPVPSGISFKLISNEGLDITHKQAIIWTVVITSTLPLVFAVAGIVVYIRRRHS